MAIATQTVAAVPDKRQTGTTVRLGSTTKTSFWIVAGTLATILSVAAAAGIQLRNDHAVALEQVERESKTFATVSGSVIGAALDRTQEAILKAVRVAPGSNAVAADPAVVNVIALDREGKVVWDRSGAPAAPTELHDTKLLQKLMSSPDGVRFLTGPIADSEFGKSEIALAIRSAGTERQYLMAILNADYFTKLLETIQGTRSVGLAITNSQSQAVSVTGIDPTLLTVSAASFPPNITTNPTLRYVPVGSTNHLVAARLIPGYDLHLITSARTADALSNWYDSLPLYSILIFGPSLLGAALAWALLNQIERTSRSDSALRRTEERFELAVSGAKCGIWDWDVLHQRMYWSGAMNALVGQGKQPRIVTLSEVEELVHPDDLRLFQSISQSVAQGGGSYDQAFRVRHSDGHYVWIRAKGQAYRTLRAEGGRLSGIVLDISDQKSADARVDTAERVLQAAFENAAEGFALWDRDDRLMLCNGRFVEFYGLGQARIGEKRDVLLGAKIAQARAQDSDEPLELFDARGMTGTIELQHCDGRWLLVSERRVLDGEKIIVATDITALKAHEDELKASRTLLETQTQELGEFAVRLESEKVRAEEGSRAKSEFLANMSHELRTPLNAIIGFSDVMRNELFGTLPPRYVEYAADIHSSGQHLLHVISEVLNMSELQSGKLQLQPAPVAISTIINEAMKSIEDKTQSKRLTVQVAGKSEIKVLADEAALTQVLRNLLSNAVKFNSSDGFVTIEARDDGDKASIWIHDTGIGISEENLQRVTKPFERLERAASSTLRGGTGLGLAVAHALIELHGGSLSIESELGIGTSVHVTLPKAA